MSTIIARAEYVSSAGLDGIIKTSFYGDHNMSNMGMVLFTEQSITGG